MGWLYLKMFHHTDGMAGDTLHSSRKAQQLRRRRFYINTAAADSEGVREILHHPADVWHQFWFLRDNSRVDIGHKKTFGTKLFIHYL